MQALAGARQHHFAALSIAAAVITIALKALAWWITGSVGLLSDALESFVNLAGASFALWMILITQVPPDANHPFGHGKAEYFSAGFEGVLIFGAALAILVTAGKRLLAPEPLEALGWGIAFSAASTGLNLAVAVALRGAAARLRSIALEADSRHLMTDVWTSVGVIAGIVLVGATGWWWLDPVIALGVGLHILLEGRRLLQAAVDGLMDRSLDPAELAAVVAALQGFAARDVAYRNLKTRRAGARSYVQVDILVPGEWSVARGHGLLDEIEAGIAAALPGAVVTTHLEPLRG